MSKKPRTKPCRTEVWFDALTLESRKDLRFKGAFLSAEKHKQLWGCKIIVKIVDETLGVVNQHAIADCSPPEKVYLHGLAKTVMAEAQDLCKQGDVIREVNVHAWIRK